jgi:hypothetical protein
LKCHVVRYGSPEVIQKVARPFFPSIPPKSRKKDPTMQKGGQEVHLKSHFQVKRKLVLKSAGSLERELLEGRFDQFQSSS